MARVTAKLIRRAYWNTRTHIACEDDETKPMCGRRGSYRGVTHVTAPICVDCAEKWHELHPRSGLFSHVVGLELDSIIEERMDELASENKDLREQIEKLARDIGETRPRPRRTSKP